MTVLAVGNAIQPEAESLRRLELLATFMDSAVGLPVTRASIGADAIAGLVPGVGPLLTAGVSAYLVAEAARHRVPAGILARMAGNVVLDAGLSAIPVVGFLADIFFKANQRNIRLLHAHLHARAAGR